MWSDTYTEADKSYVVQTNTDVIQRCLLMTTDPGDLVLDPTCGSGTTAYAAEQWGKRSPDELEAGVQEWVHRKFLMQQKCELRESLYPGKWQYELVVNEVRHPEELPLIEKEGVKILHLANIIAELRLSKTCIKSAAGRDLVELVMLKAGQSSPTAAGQ
jgi:hypothetical protein